MKDFISFPSLNLKFGISDTIFEFQLFGVNFTLRWYGLLIAVGFLLAVIYAMKRAKSFDINPDKLIDVTLVSALFAFVGARLYYVLFSSELDYYFENPARIFQIWKGGLAIYGGIILAFVTAIWMCRVRKVNTLAVFDIGSIGFLIGQGIGRWGNLFNQEAFGGNTSLPWGMTGSIIRQGVNGTGYNPSQPVHPTFLYESLWCLAGFVILHLVSKKAYKFKGQLFSMYIMWYGLGRFMIEGLRADSLMLGATMRVSQIVAALSVIGGLVLLLFLRSRHNSLPADFVEQVEGESGDATELTDTQEQTDTPLESSDLNDDETSGEQQKTGAGNTDVSDAVEADGIDDNTGVQDDIEDDILSSDTERGE